MNGMLDMQDPSDVNHLQGGKVYEGNTTNYGMSSSPEIVLRSTAGEVRISQQKFKSRHFPEPYWGHDD